MVSVLSGNRNFEGRINPDVKMNYLASPPLCVAYALAGTMDIDIVGDPIGTGADGEDVYLRDIWPSEKEVAETVGEAVQSDMFRRSYGEVFAGDERWNGLEVPGGERFAWSQDSTYVRLPPYFQDMPAAPEAVTDIERARVSLRCSATASPPITSRPRARSSATARRAATCRSRASSRATSTPTAHAAAITK